MLESDKEAGAGSEGFHAIWRRLQAYPFDRPDETVSFTDRLVSETGWSRQFAARAVEEYRRFAALAACAGHPVSPSKAVDRVWHLHLTETRRYWGEFCAEVLKYEFHHEPNRGGEAEDRRHAEMYAGTLQSYLTFFEDEPPADVWPRAPSPKGLGKLARSLSGKGSARALVATAVAALAGCEQIYNSSAPDAIQGPDFIKVYLALAVAAFAGMWVFQTLFAAASLRPKGPLKDLGAYDWAYLAGGGRRVLETVLYRLHQTGRIEIDSRGRKARLKAEIPPGAPPIDRAVGDAVAMEQLKGTASIRRSLDQLRERLERLGLLPDAGSRAAVWGLALLFVGPVLALGLVRLYFGASNHRPVGYLTVAMLALAIAGVVRTAHLLAPRRWSQAVRREVTRRAEGPRAVFGAASGGVISVALFGVGMDAPELRTFVRSQLAQGGGDGGGSGCGGGGCGGGCGG